MTERKKYRWIDESIDIDFPVPSEIKYLMEDMEKLDEEENYGYINYYDSLDTTAKEAYVLGMITREQWYTLLRKYGGILK